MIYGYDETCKGSSHWKNQMRVTEVMVQQPFYNVLVDGRYFHQNTYGYFFF